MATINLVFTWALILCLCYRGICTNYCEGHSCDYMCVQKQRILKCICPDGSEQNSNDACPSDIKFDSNLLLMNQKPEGFRKTEREAGVVCGITIVVILAVVVLFAYRYYQKYKVDLHNRYDLSIHFQNPSYARNPGITSDYVVPIVSLCDHEDEKPLSIHTTKGHSTSLFRNNNSKQSLEIMNSNQSDVELINDETGYNVHLIKS